MNVLHVPPGFVSSIRSKGPASKLLVMSNYEIEEIKDEYRYEIDYFKLLINKNDKYWYNRSKRFCWNSFV